MSARSKKVGHKFKLDLRLLLVDDEANIDGCTGELARKATIKKIYKDKLKSTVATICHLNALVQDMSFARASDVRLIKMPILQIAGFAGKLSVLSLNRRKEYHLEEVSSFCFPQTLIRYTMGLSKL